MDWITDELLPPLITVILPPAVVVGIFWFAYWRGWIPRLMGFEPKEKAMKLLRKEEWKPEHLIEFVLAGFDLTKDVQIHKLTTTSKLDMKTEEPVGTPKVRVFLSMRSTRAADEAMLSIARSAATVTSLSLTGTNKEGIRQWEGVAKVSDLEWTFVEPRNEEHSQFLHLDLESPT